jgi:hypothetical protein
VDEIKKPAAGNSQASKECGQRIIASIAVEYINAGVSVIPIRLDGSKAPSIPSWSQYQQRIATAEEIEAWFSRPAGIGIVCGVVSGGLEVLDFDDGSLFWPWFEKVPTIATRLPVIETPNDGFHVIYRCEEIGGNRKIAVDPAKEKQTLIESRGEGGYIIGTGSPLGIHAKRDRTYVQVMGPVLPEITTITPQERKELWHAARSFTKQAIQPITIKEPQAIRKAFSSYADRVIDQFNRAADWSNILEGWTSRDGIHWTRPGKSFGTSAKICHAADGTPLIAVFSSNAGSLSLSGRRSPGHNGSIATLSAFECLVRLRFNGDRKQAYRSIKEVQQ